MQETLEKIEVAAFPILVIPFFGTPVPVKIRELNQAQISACGDFSLIETLEDKIFQKTKSKKCNVKDIISYAERNHNIVKAALIKPTYTQIFKMIEDELKDTETDDSCQGPIDLNRLKEEIKSIRQELWNMKPGPQRKILEEELNAKRIWCEFLLPNDFMSYIVSYALGVDKSDIKDVSEKILFEAAILAKHGHDNPADHIDGRFTPFMRDDINKRAWYIFHNKRKEK